MVIFALGMGPKFVPKNELEKSLLLPAEISRLKKKQFELTTGLDGMHKITYEVQIIC